MIKNKIPENSAYIRKIALVIVFLMLLLSVSGCNKNCNVKKEEMSSPSKISSDSNVVSNDSSSELASSEQSSLNNITSTVKKTLTFEEGKTVKNQSGEDLDEVIFNDDNVVWNSALKGYADDAADARRKEIINTNNTEYYYKIEGTKYYISPRGDDGNDGKSPQTPLRTVDSIASIDLKSGDAVLFERNSIFRLNQTFSTVGGVIYGSYGTGEKPKIYGSPKNFAKAIWKPSKKKNVWQTNYVYDSVCNAVFDNGREVGFLKNSFRSLTQNTHFYQDESKGLLYLYCDKGNPTNVYKSIEISPALYCFLIPTGVNGVIIDNICIKYAGAGGVCYWFGNSDGKVTNCEIAFIGGTTNGKVRLGNAIGAWQGNRNMNWNHNWIYQTFDTAISPQGHGGDGCVYANISMSDNLLEYNNSDFEFWDRGALFRDIKIENNICRFTSLGWGTRYNDAGYRGIEGVFYCHTDDAIIDGTISVKGLIIDCPGRQIINWRINSRDFSRYKVQNIKLYVKQSYRTMDVIVYGFKKNESDEMSLKAVNEADLKNAFTRFSPDAFIKWYE